MENQEPVAQGIERLKQKKSEERKITMLSVPDYYSARIIYDLGVDCVMVGDSLAKHLQGEETVFSANIGDIVYYCKIVRKAVQNSILIADMPYSAYELGADDAVTNAKHLIEVGGADAVKLEGGADYFDRIKALVKAGIPVMGHLGLKDSYYKDSSPLVATASDRNKDWDRILDNAKKLEKLGVFALMLECVPGELGKLVHSKLKIPVLGQGAGHHVDGQCLVFHEMMGFHEGYRPKYMKRYARLSQVMSQAIKDFVEDVQTHKFPCEEHEY